MREDPNLLNKARDMRHQPTMAEQKLWRLLRGRQLGGHKFRRQVPIGRYIVDLVCLEARVIIEADGGQHDREDAAEKARTQFLESQGFRVLRFWNNEVLGNIEGSI